jgi:hypothetical protein
VPRSSSLITVISGGIGEIKISAAKTAASCKLPDPQNVNSCISKTQYGDLIYSNDHSNQLQSWLASKEDAEFLNDQLSHFWIFPW